MNADFQPPLIEPLTEREQDILALLVQGKSNNQIAAALVLSLNTVKWYNRQIYGKLGVENREGVAERARELGLVDSGEPAGQQRQIYNLPHPATPLLGRERELVELEGLLLDDRTRIVSIIGPGGVGKTRLALELAHRLNGRFAGGAAFVPLAPLLSEESIPPAIAQSLRFAFQGSGLDEKTQLLNFLREKKLIIVLDNYEHLIDSAPLLTEIAEAAPELKMVVTSREKLKLRIEQLYPLQSLSLKDWETVEQAKKDPAVRLFLDYGRRVRPNFELRTEDLNALHQILQLVEGMPLAIILASAWLELLTPVEIAAEIQSNIDFLEADYQDLPDRQRSMRVVFDASWKQLKEAEQKVFSALTVFRGGFTLDAAREVVGATPGILLGLAGRSLLNRDENGRFEIHELLRQFGAEKMGVDSNYEKKTHKQHSTYYCNFLQQREELLKGPRATEAETEITTDFENINAAWKWAVENEEELVFQAQTGLGLYFLGNGRPIEGEAAFQIAATKLIERGRVDARPMIELLAWRIHFAKYFNPEGFQTMVTRVINQAEDYLTQAEETGEDIRVERAFFLLAKAHVFRQFDESVNLLEQSISLYKEIDSSWEMAQAYDELAWFYVRQGKFILAIEQWIQSVQLLEMVGDSKSALRMKLDIARFSAVTGQLTKALDSIMETLAIIQAGSDEWLTASAYWRLFHVLFLSGRYEEALKTIAKSRPMFANWGLMGWVSTHDSYQCWTTLLLGRYDEAEDQVLRFYKSNLNSAKNPNFNSGLVKLVQGCRALALVNFLEAKSHLLESLETFRAINQPDDVAKAQAALGYVVLQEGDITTARKYLVDALSFVSDFQILTSTLMVLPAVSLLLAKLGNTEQAIEVYTLACTYNFVANSRWFQDVVGYKIEAWTDTLSLETAVMAQERGRGSDLWETAESLLRELEQQSQYK